ncbi:MAG TPA: CD225/dispanin family protein [Pyrinomonadaceae bacterium]|nr:CD225/dispanin family protein [Pyrinomonadaceae bacterium]
MSQQYGAPAPSQSVPNYLIPAILSTLFCCLPLGVVSIIFATQVNSKLAAGDTAGAMESSKKAKMFMFIAIGLGALSWIVGVVLWIFVIAANNM